MGSNTSRFTAFLSATAAITSFLVVGCSDSGGETTPATVTYTGLATPATITGASAVIIADSAFTVALTDSSRMEGIGNTVKRLVVLDTVADNASGVALDLPACSGSANATVIKDPVLVDWAGAPILYSMSVTFNDYVEDLGGGICSTVAYKGEMTLEVGYDGPLAAAPEMNSLAFTFAKLFITEGNVKDGFNGTFVDAWDTLTDLSTFTFNMDYSETDGHTYRMENFVISFDTAYNATGISGRLYDPGHGYVDIVTTTPFSYAGLCRAGVAPADWAVPDLGAMTLTGNVEFGFDANTADCLTYAVTVGGAIYPGNW